MNNIIYNGQTTYTGCMVSYSNYSVVSLTKKLFKQDVIIKINTGAVQRFELSAFQIESHLALIIQNIFEICLPMSPWPKAVQRWATWGYNIEATISGAVVNIIGAHPITLYRHKSLMRYQIILKLVFPQNGGNVRFRAKFSAPFSWSVKFFEDIPQGSALSERNHSTKW